jgi:excinuclease UvrABC helicase subunit UvrB
MKKYLNTLGIELPPEENKLHDIEESTAAAQKKKINGEKFLNQINQSFNLEEQSPSDAEVKFLNITIENLTRDLSEHVENENYEEAAVIRDKIKEHIKRLNFN